MASWHVTKEVYMSDQPLSRMEWLSYLNDHLKNEGYADRTVTHCVRVAGAFLIFLEKQQINLRSVQPAHVEKYLQHALRRFRRRYGHPEHKSWRSARTAPIRMLLRMAHGQWPSTADPITRAKKARDPICDPYAEWMVEIRGLASSTVAIRRSEALRFLSWIGNRSSRKRVASLTIAEVDRYLKDRSSLLQRSSMPAITVLLRAFLRWLHSTGQTSRDLSALVIGPSRYAFETVPAALPPQHVEKVLDFVQRDDSAKGIRDYAILMLLATYGMRASEIGALRLDDIDWRKEAIRVCHSKTGVTSHLPLMPKVGAAILRYLREGRPKTSVREIFLRDYAPYQPFKSGHLFRLIRERLRQVGVVSGKRGPHAFRHARAVSLLRAAVPLKEIGDILGHRSPLSTMTYLKLATEDLRMVALEIPKEVKA